MSPAVANETLDEFDKRRTLGDAPCRLSEQGEE